MKVWMGWGALLVAGFFLLPQFAAARPSYRKLLHQNTRQDRVYELRNFEPKIVWHATRLTPELVAAQVEHLDGELHFSAEEKAEEMKSRMEPANQGEAFFISFFTMEKTFNNLSRQDVPWKIELTTGEGDGAMWIRPVSILKLRAGGFDRFLYPYIDRWSDNYLVVFPRAAASDAGQTVRLRMLGLGDRSTLEFD